ncbi:NAD-dependent epimerase/dehydratase family protein [Chloroflexota bacterium]
MSRPSNFKNCLVLGATGFIGGHIAKAAHEDGILTRGLRRSPGALGHLGGTPIEWVEGNLENFESLLNAMQGVEVVFHAAGYYPSKSRPNQVASQMDHARKEINTVIKACIQAEVKLLVFTSSLTTVGNPPAGELRLADETDHYIPGTVGKSGYYECKHVMEQKVLEANGKGIDTVVLNPTAVFGPGDVHMTMGKILLAVKNGYVIFCIPATTNVVDVRDVAIGHLAAAKKGIVGERYILGGENVTLKEVIHRVGGLYNARPPRFEISLKTIDRFVRVVDHIPFLSAGNHLRAIPFWQGFDTSKAVDQLGFSTRPFEETVKDAIDWFEENTGD